MSIYGYARVSSKDQHEDRQIIALKHFGVEQIFCDHLSGKNFNRLEYRKLLRRLKDDDVLVVKSIDRLGRNYAKILKQWCRITKDKGAAIVVLDTPILDTRRDRDIIGTLIADLVLQIMSAFAQIENEEQQFIAVRDAGVAFEKIHRPCTESTAKLPKSNTDVCARRADGVVLKVPRLTLRTEALGFVANPAVVCRANDSACHRNHNAPADKN